MPSSGMLDHSLTMSGCVGRLNTLYVFLCCSLLRVATFDFTCFGRVDVSGIYIDLYLYIISLLIYYLIYYLESSNDLSLLIYYLESSNDLSLLIYYLESSNDLSLLIYYLIYYLESSNDLSLLIYYLIYYLESSNDNDGNWSRGDFDFWFNLYSIVDAFRLLYFLHISEFWCCVHFFPGSCFLDVNKVCSKIIFCSR